MQVRFAPSPTGAFHLGNLRTAWISHAWARHLAGRWVVRFEDIDHPRVVHHAKDSQLADMAALGLIPDAILDQSARYDRHQELWRRAIAEGQVYPCTCTRKEVLAGLASAPHGPEAIYDGHCRREPPREARPEMAWRFRQPASDGREDFIVARSDRDQKNFLPSYHWACAIDDFDGGYELLVRAWDLRAATDQQRAIQRWLGAKRFPAVFHCALVTGEQGKRLEKRTRGITLGEVRAAGIAPGEVAERLARSFRLTEEYAPEKIWDEQQRAITLAELGFGELRPQY